MVVWIPDLNEHKLLPTFALNSSKNYEWFEKPHQKLERVFHQDYQTTLSRSKNLVAPVILSTHFLFLVFGYPDETLFLMFDILFPKFKKTD